MGLDVKRLSASEVHEAKVAELGLDATALDLKSTESLAASLRRAAGLLCPCAASTLIRAVCQPLDGLVADLDAAKQTIEATLEAMVAHGDLLEELDVAAEDVGSRGVLVYAAPPSFVARTSGAALLLGITPDGRSALTESLEAQVEYINHFRRLSPDASVDLHAELLQSGLIQLTYESWLNAPMQEAPTQYLARIDALLDSAGRSGEIPGLQVLDFTRPVRYYRGRWVEPQSRTGRFMGRRSQGYGADLWCYVSLRDGRPERFVDLPLAGSKIRGCDEAWKLQLAIDAQRGEPQQLHRWPGPNATQTIELFSPIPMFARRRWDAVGELVSRTGCLLAYCFSEHEIAEELQFARNTLWLSDMDAGSDR
jgi:hypothetical protein